MGVEPDPMTCSWELLRDRAADVSRSPQADLAVDWGFDVLERRLGPDWPQACQRCGGLPPELVDGPSSLRGLPMLIDLAGALELLSDRPGIGKLRRMLRTGPTSETIAAVRCSLRLATAGLRAGLAPTLEHGNPPIDVMLVGHDRTLMIETKTLRRTDLTIDVDGWLHELTPTLTRSIAEYRVEIHAMPGSRSRVPKRWRLRRGSPTQPA